MPRMAAMTLLLVLTGCGPDGASVLTGPDSVDAFGDGALQLSTEQIPASFFGMHLVSVWAPGTTWPDVPVGIYRLHGATPRWDRLHTGPGRWQDDVARGTGLSRIDAVLLFQERFGPSAIPLYVIGGEGDGVGRGGFPPWVAGRDTIAAWREHVRMLGSRYRGRIRHWEIWNEPDSRDWYVGSTELLVRLTDAAAEELRAIDPRNVIIAPSFTDAGLRAMQEFLRAGGGRNVDIIAWHQNNHFEPERDTVLIRRVQRIMRRYDVAHLPLWTTEGHSNLGVGGDPVAIVARTYLTLWAYGVSSFSWYAWDIYDYGPAHPGPWVTLVERGRPGVPAPAGVAYGVVAGWMIGSRMMQVTIDDGTWMITLDRPAGRSWVIWSTAASPQPVQLPDGVTVVRTLDGRVGPVQHSSYRPTARPVLFSTK